MNECWWRGEHGLFDIHDVRVSDHHVIMCQSEISMFRREVVKRIRDREGSRAENKRVRVGKLRGRMLKEVLERGRGRN